MIPCNFAGVFFFIASATVAVHRCLTACTCKLRYQALAEAGVIGVWAAVWVGILLVNMTQKIVVEKFSIRHFYISIIFVRF
ncbi:MAG: hypothetical protein BGN92_10145 [Sphingobacteriales bacterium 41-5]|nr:MAG: hypothetical protein BGN92_10145 [Sphingobacteriales bacterium 41-5]